MVKDRPKDMSKININSQSYSNCYLTKTDWRFTGLRYISDKKQNQGNWKGQNSSDNIDN